MNNDFKIGESIIYLKNKRITGVIMQSVDSVSL